MKTTLNFSDEILLVIMYDLNVLFSLNDIVLYLCTCIFLWMCALCVLLHVETKQWHCSLELGVQEVVSCPKSVLGAELGSFGEQEVLWTIKSSLLSSNVLLNMVSSYFWTYSCIFEHEGNCFVVFLLYCYPIFSIILTSGLFHLSRMNWMVIYFEKENHVFFLKTNFLKI